MNMRYINDALTKSVSRYDVAACIDKRKLDTGKLEVKARFAGFGSQEDEWVNIASAVRQRSLSCETTECMTVLPGDLTFCFQEDSEQALYFDAKTFWMFKDANHDVRDCRCRFWVRYRHDQTEEVVPRRRVCRRPETEQRLQQAREAIAASGRLSEKDSAMALNGTPNINIASQFLQLLLDNPALLSMPRLTLTRAVVLIFTRPSNRAPVLQDFNACKLSTPDTKPSIHQQAAPPPVPLLIQQPFFKLQDQLLIC